MSKLHRNSIKSKNKIVPKEGQPGFLCSNNESDNGCPSLSFNSNFSEDIAIDYLASIIVEIFLESEKDEWSKANN